MDSVTLCRLACSDPIIRSKFGGVYSSDNLPQYRNKQEYFIINLDPGYLPGSHWIALSFKKQKCSYFCSYGSKPFGNILIFIRENSKFLEINSKTYQANNTATCGLFCLYFLYNVSRNRPINLHSSDRLLNERIVKRLVVNRLRLYNCCYTPVTMQTCKNMHESFL